MLTDEPTTGGIQASSWKRKSLAKASLAWNMRDPVFVELFGEELGRLKIEVGNNEKVGEGEGVEELVGVGVDGGEWGMLRWVGVGIVVLGWAWMWGKGGFGW